MYIELMYLFICLSIHATPSFRRNTVKTKERLHTPSLRNMMYALNPTYCPLAAAWLAKPKCGV